MLPTTKLAYRNGMCTCDSLLYVSHTVKGVLESGCNAWIVLINFSEAFDMVDYHGILCRLCCGGIGGFVLSIFTGSMKPITARYCGWLSV